MGPMTTRRKLLWREKRCRRGRRLPQRWEATGLEAVAVVATRQTAAVAATCQTAAVATRQTAAVAAMCQTAAVATRQTAAVATRQTARLRRADSDYPLAEYPSLAPPWSVDTRQQLQIRSLPATARRAD